MNKDGFQFLETLKICMFFTQLYFLNLLTQVTSNKFILVAYAGTTTIIIFKARRYMNKHIFIK